MGSTFTGNINISGNISVPNYVPAVTFIDSGTNGGFTSTHNIVLSPTLTAGNYIIFVSLFQAAFNFTNVTLEGQQCYQLQNARADQRNHQFDAWYIEGLTGGGNKTVSVTLDAATTSVNAWVVRIDNGRIDKKATIVSTFDNPVSLSRTVTTLGNELVLGAYHTSTTATPSFTNLDTELLAPTTISETNNIGLRAQTCVNGSPDTFSVDWSVIADAIFACVRIY